MKIRKDQNGIKIHAVLVVIALTHFLKLRDVRIVIISFMSRYLVQAQEIIYLVICFVNYASPKEKFKAMKKIHLIISKGACTINVCIVNLRLLESSVYIDM